MTEIYNIFVNIYIAKRLLSRKFNYQFWFTFITSDLWIFGKKGGVRNTWGVTSWMSAPGGSQVVRLGSGVARQGAQSIITVSDRKGELKTISD